jgi:hypothetical protein
MPYPDDRYPAIPVFPRPQNTLMTKNAALMDRDWYEVVSSYIEDLAAGGTPALPENHTFRGNSSNVAEATDIIEIHTDGAAITVDHPLDNATPRVVAIIPTALGATKPSAVGKKDGTLLITYIP